MKNIYLITGRSAAGKTTVANELEKKYNLKQIQSYTERPKRYDNETGHTFVTKEEFDKLKDFVAYTVYQGNRYCATLSQVETNDVYVINPDGIEYFKNNYKGNKNYKVICIEAKVSDCYNRMENRGGLTFNQINERIRDDIIAIDSIKDQIDLKVWNSDDKLSDVVKKVYNFIQECENEI